MATIKGIVELASIVRFTVVTGAEARPSTAACVLWVGGTTRPLNMAGGDLWFKEVNATASPPQFVTTSLNTLTQNVPFSQGLVLNGTTPMSFTVVTGSLPAGLTIHSTTGVISGTPTASGTYSFTIIAANAQGDATQAFSGTVSATAVAPAIVTTTLNTMTQGTAFTQTLTATGTSPLSWSASGGLLPAGLTLNSSNGTISGTPTGTGPYDFTITVTNTAGNASRQFTGNIGNVGSPPDITTTSLTAMQTGVAFTQTLSRTGSVPMTWGISAGTIPAGLSINSSTGAISGTPTAPGAYSFTVQASNSYGSDTQAYTGTVAAGASSGVYSIMGSAAPPWSLTSYTDAASGSWLSAQYYSFGGEAALSAGSKIVGARLYVPTGSAHIGQAWNAAWYRSTSQLWPGPTGPSLISNYETNGSKKAGSVLVAGWNEILFDLQGDAVPAPGGWFIGVQIGDGTRYLYDSTYTADSVRNPQGKNFFLAEMTGTAVVRSWYRDTGSSARSYGIDVLMSIP